MQDLAYRVAIDMARMCHQSPQPEWITAGQWDTKQAQKILSELLPVLNRILAQPKDLTLIQRHHLRKNIKKAHALRQGLSKLLTLYDCPIQHITSNKTIQDFIRTGEIHARSR